MFLEPSDDAFAVFHLCGGGTAAQISNPSGTVLINGTPTSIPTTVENDGSGRLVVRFTLPDTGLDTGDVIHATLDADHGGEAMQPFTVEVGQITPTAISQEAIAQAVWDADLQEYTTPRTFGNTVSRELLKFCQWVGIR